MIAWKALMLGVVVGSLVACSPDNSFGDGANTNDGGNDVVAVDTSNGNDTGTSHPDVTDTGTGNDVQAPHDGGAGTCGATALTCLCGCGMSASCQQGCLTSMTCQQCVVGAQTMCCPSQASAFGTCAMAAQMDSDAGAACTTQACIMMRCMTEYTAFQNCVTTGSSSDTACQSHLAVCFGSYPIMCM